MQDNPFPRPRHSWVNDRKQMTTGAPVAPDAKWNAFVASHPHGHILQTSRWAGLKAAFGWTADRAVVRAGSEPDAPILAGASLLFRRLPWGQTLAYAPKGPLVDWTDAGQVRGLLAEMRGVCRRHRAALLKIEPELPASPVLAAGLAGYGFRPSPQRVQPLSTIHIDLIADVETILARMKSKWRYNVRLAERKGVIVREGAPADLAAIQGLLDLTGERDGFGVHSSDYYRMATDLFMITENAGAGLQPCPPPPGITENAGAGLQPCPPGITENAGAGLQPCPPGSITDRPEHLVTVSRTDKLATWLIAEHAGEMLAAIAVFALGTGAWYMWGASGDSGRNLMPNHALQWAAIQWAKARGCRTYDLWGIPDEVGADPEAFADPESWGEGGLWGVYRFKQGFGGEVVRYAGAWDLPVSGIGYWVYRLALRVRKDMPG
ncbi:MAG: hypothetical protein CVU38_16850 [Chloroflexi bacterium HGW-Chloroflexi-1]|nr:MAG: hypothetical protein CVU38_16850 [Chloroflexi bacterium HGW-Chloroflexi-1]